VAEVWSASSNPEKMSDAIWKAISKALPGALATDLRFITDLHLREDRTRISREFAVKWGGRLICFSMISGFRIEDSRMKDFFAESRLLH
jgi:hypothetical protein